MSSLPFVALSLRNLFDLINIAINLDVFDEINYFCIINVNVAKVTYKNCKFEPKKLNCGCDF